MAGHADLWGELTPSVHRTSATILREQAALLGSKTKHVIEERVDTEIAGRYFYHSFNLVVPALDNYSYQLFRIWHGIDLYPVDAEYPVGEVKDEEAFVNWLGQKLSSPETKRIIGNLLAQANS